MLKLATMTLFSLFSLSTFALPLTEDIPQAPKEIKATLLTEITEKGQKINGIALEYEDNVLSGNELDQLYQVQTQLDNKELEDRSIVKAYVNNQATISSVPQAGKFVIIELDSKDKNATLYSLKKENDQPVKFRSKDKAGNLTVVEKVQTSSVPQFYEKRLVYHISQMGLLKLVNGKTLAQSQLALQAVKNRVKNAYIDDFSAHQVSLGNKNNNLNYRLYIPESKNNQNYPLTIFLHGSGQVGSDNLAHLLSSKGAIATLQYEQGFVLAPQYNSVFDPFDDVNKGQQGGIHWQTENRQQLVLKMIDETIKANTNIDKNRIYLVGLSRGAEGALNLLLKRPHFFAGALLMSGREAGTIEWIDGNATKAMLAPIKNVPMWLFHSKEDNISPVVGSRINYQLLTELNAPNVKYTEFTFNQASDNGIVNNNPHNTWDAVFNSPEIMQWLLNQKLQPTQ